jgi:hypothetical protein
MVLKALDNLIEALVPDNTLEIYKKFLVPLVGVLINLANVQQDIRNTSCSMV